VGASIWLYRVLFRTRVADALEALQLRLLASGEYDWDPHRGSRPTTLAELAAVRADEGFRSWGTHSILDLQQVVPSERTEQPATVRLLAAAEIRELFGTDYPTAPDFERRERDLVHRLVADVWGWHGLCTILYEEYTPIEYAFWGVSGG
jgi:hypothetical protein